MTLGFGLIGLLVLLAGVLVFVGLVAWGVVALYNRHNVDKVKLSDGLDADELKRVQGWVIKSLEKEREAATKARILAAINDDQAQPQPQVTK